MLRNAVFSKAYKAFAGKKEYAYAGMTGKRCESFIRYPWKRVACGQKETVIEYGLKLEEGYNVRWEFYK